MRKIIALGIGSFFLWSCNNHPEKSTTHQETEIHSAHHHDESAEAIELDNGEKWVVNEEMKPFVLKGSELVNTYVQNKQTDYRELARQIKEQNSQLIKSCTMDGKSHDELHKWLHPHLEIVKNLGEETDAARADEIVMQLRESYEVYHQYFQ